MSEFKKDDPVYLNGDVPAVVVGRSDVGQYLVQRWDGGGWRADSAGEVAAGATLGEIGYWWANESELTPREVVPAPAPAPGGAKDDIGKLPMDLIPPELLVQLAELHADTDRDSDEENTVSLIVRQLAAWRANSYDALAPLYNILDLLGGDGGYLAGLPKVARVLQYGAWERPRADGSKGYGPNNWQGVEHGERRYYAAALRHLCAAAEDKVATDDESGLPHLGHAATCIMFLAWLTGPGKKG